jgi:predicted HTH domain antitoxin
MLLILEIPDSALAGMEMPLEDLHAELRRDLAIVLYARGALSLGKAAEFARLSRWAFEDLLAKRKAARNYDEEDLRHDLAWARTKSESRPG